MLKNHLTIALRVLRRERGYAFLNVAGLAVGLACCVLIVLYVRDELGYDRHHENADRIVRVTRPTTAGSHWAPVGPPTGPALADAFPEIETYARVFPLGDQTVLNVPDRAEQRVPAPGGAYADPTLFGVFTLPLVRGDAATALAEPGRVVLSASMAERLFGDADPMGQSLGLRNLADLAVAGVMADPPETTHLPLDYLVSMRTVTDESPWMAEARGWAGFYTYLLLRDAGDADALAAKLPGFVDSFFGDDATDELPSTLTSFELQPITGIHLHSKLEKEYRPNGDIVYVWVFGLVAVFVLAIAIVNFVNLTTARSGARLREVGVRKAIGSTRGQLARQFFTESVLMSGFALVVAYGLTLMALPLLGTLTGKAFGIDAVHSPEIMLGLVGLALVTGLAAGLYPAWHLARFNTTRALRGDPSGQHTSLLRRGLVVFQFALSIFMLAGTAIVYTQLDYVRSTALGFDKERVVSVRIDGFAAGPVRDGLDAFRQELERSPDIAHVSLAADAPGTRYSLEPVRPDGAAEDDGTIVRIAWGVDHDYARTLGLTITAGRDFSRQAPADTSAWLINESAVRELGLTDPVGQVLRWGSDRYAGPIVGVVEDFHFRSLHSPVEPLVIPLRPGVGNMLLVRVRDDVPSALAHAETVLTDFAPGAVFRYRFLDETFDALYHAEQRLNQVFGLFAGLAILIGCLGLFGLAAYTAARRRKEIGVRKVLGASITSVVVLLTKEFARLVAVAFVVAAPLAWLVMNHWLDGFAYRIDLGPGLFLLAGGLALGIALLTVSAHAVRAATTDPVRSLRHE